MWLKIQIRNIVGIWMAAICLLASFDLAIAGVPGTNQVTFMDKAQISNVFSQLNNLGSSVNGSSPITGGIEDAKALGKLFNFWSKAAPSFSKIKKLGNNDCDPDFSLPAQALMPSSCSGSGDCIACYENGVKRMTFARQHLERVGCIYRSTLEKVKTMEGLGDGFSSLNPLVDMKWQVDKISIDKELDQLKTKANESNGRYLEELREALMDISACEEKYGQKDWFQKYGFMYYEFMQAKYTIQ